MKMVTENKLLRTLNEWRTTSEGVRDFVNASNKAYNGYGYATGCLEVMVRELIAELPRVRREAYREEFKRLTKEMNLRIQQKKETV